MSKNNSNHRQLAFPQDQIEKMLTNHVITQAEEKVVVFQRVLTSILTEIIFQITCHKLTKADGDISVLLRKSSAIRQ